MPSLPPLFSGFGRRNRRYQQPQEDSRQVWRTCKTVLIKLLPRSCSANARRREEVEQMIRDQEHEQNLTRVMEQAGAMGQTLREKGKVGKSDPPHTQEVTITEKDMINIAEELENGCTGSRGAADAEKKDGPTEEKDTESDAEGDENVSSESGNSVDNFDIGDIERIEGKDREKSEASEDLEDKNAPTNALVHKDEVPETADLRSSGTQVRFTEPEMANGETSENVNHHLNPFYMYKEPIRQDTCGQAGPSNAASMYPTTLVPDIPPPSIQVPENITNIWRANEEWGPPPRQIDGALAPHPPVTIPKSPFILATTPARAPEDLMEDLFMDVRNFVSDVEESLQRVAYNVQKRQEVLAEKMRAMEIEFRRAR